MLQYYVVLYKGLGTLLKLLLEEFNIILVGLTLSQMIIFSINDSNLEDALRIRIKIKGIDIKSSSNDLSQNYRRHLKSQDDMSA
jgi:hypothetical protein